MSILVEEYPQLEKIEETLAAREKQRRRLTLQCVFLCAAVFGLILFGLELFGTEAAAALIARVLERILSELYALLRQIQQVFHFGGFSAIRM